MSPKIKNIIIFVGIGLALVLIYVFFIKGGTPEPSLVSSGSTTATGDQQAPSITQDFLTLLLNIKSIRLDDSIFSDPAFLSLKDSTIVINEDVGTQGRPNPFAPIGSDNSVAPTAPTAPAGPVTPPANTSTTPTPPAKTTTTTTTTVTTPPPTNLPAGNGAGTTSP